MNKRKQHVIKKAHQLFVDKGFQATSIQDILEYSGISKGTFYNYFSSKNELLIAIFKDIYKGLEKERNQILIGQDPTDIELFIKQFEIQLKANRKNKLLNLFEEVLVSNDEELKHFIKQGQLRTYQWIVHRFSEIFGADKKPYLLDCALMFIGIIQHTMKFYYATNKSPSSIYKVVRYSVRRIEKIIEDLADSGEQLIKPELLENLLHKQHNSEASFIEKLKKLILSLKESINQHQEKEKFHEILDFIESEFIDQSEPRRHLIEAALIPLKQEADVFGSENIMKLDQLVMNYFVQANGL